MSKRGRTEEQILRALHQADGEREPDRNKVDFIGCYNKNLPCQSTGGSNPSEPFVAQLPGRLTLCSAGS